MRRTCCRSQSANGTEFNCDWPGSSTEEKRTTACCSASLFGRITMSTMVTTRHPSGSITQKVMAEAVALNTVTTGWRSGTAASGSMAGAAVAKAPTRMPANAVAFIMLLMCPLLKRDECKHGGAQTLVPDDRAPYPAGIVEGTQARRDRCHTRSWLPVCFVAFDLLWLNGEDLRPLPLVERKARLRRLLRRRANHLIAEALAIEGRGKALFDAVEEYDLEGIVAKRKS